MTAWQRFGRRAVATTAVLWGVLPAYGAEFTLDYKYAQPDEEAKWAEGEYEMPPMPGNTGLYEIFINAPTQNHFLLDASTLSSGKDGVVRYVLIIRAEGGAETITFEGIHCGSGQYRIYATSRADGTWAPMRKSKWRETGNIVPRNTLQNIYFCDGPAAPRSREMLLQQMRSARDVKAFKP